jgi:phage-related protein
MGDSLDVLQSFPKIVRADLGGDLRRLQIGEMPLDSKLMKTLVLHCFIKKSRTTSKTDIKTAKERLKGFDQE